MLTYGCQFRVWPSTSTASIIGVTAAVVISAATGALLSTALRIHQHLLTSRDCAHRALTNGVLGTSPDLVPRGGHCFVRVVTNCLLASWPGMFTSFRQDMAGQYWVWCSIGHSTVFQFWVFGLWFIDDEFGIINSICMIGTLLPTFGHYYIYIIENNDIS